MSQERHLVPQRDWLANLERTAADIDDEPRRQRSGSHRNVRGADRPRSRTALGDSVAVAIDGPLGWLELYRAGLKISLVAGSCAGKAVYPVGGRHPLESGAMTPWSEPFADRMSDHAVAVSGYGPEWHEDNVKAFVHWV